MDITRSLGLDGLAYGGDYNPEQWPPAVWREDVRLMRQAGVNLVTVGVFSWARIEPAPGEFDFGWLDEVLDLLHANGIAVDLATATASPPAWLVRQYPEMLPVDARGTRLEFGSRQSYCPSSPVWRSHLLRFCRLMAERYGDHPAVRMWHVSNEYGDELSRCWCDESARAFREWLRRRYGTIEGLNEAWGTTFWSQRYADFRQVEPPRATTGPVNPSQRLDFERFSSDALLGLLTAEVEVLREVTPGLPVTTNFMGVFSPLDYWAFAAAEDVVSNDAYPDPADPDSAAHAALGYSLMRSLKRQPWMLLESAPSAVSWRDVNQPKPAGRMRLDALQAVAHGSDAVMFFQWRQARQGAEKFHSAMVGHRGEASRSYAETRALGAELARLAPVRGSVVRSEVALVVEWDSWWAQSAPDSMPSQRLRWLDQARRWHQFTTGLGHTADIVRAGGPFDGYRVLLVPGLYLVTEAQATALAAFVEAGGHLLVGPFSGVVDAADGIHPGGAPGPLRDLLGIEVDEPWPLLDGEVTRLDLAGGAFAATVWQEAVEVYPDTEVRGRYLSGRLAGRPAITRRQHGKGTAGYLSTVPDAAGMGIVLAATLAQAGLPVHECSPVEVVTRTDGATDYTFYLNHDLAPRPIATPAGATDLLTGHTVTAHTTIPGQDVLVLAHPANSEGRR
ncbi:MAG: beta-galactosidase [Propionicimonas sp.]